MKWVLAILALAVLAGCGNNKGSSDPGVGKDAGPGLVACGKTNCKAASQYCLRQMSSDGYVLSSQCAAFPSGCSTCDCAEKDAGKNYCGGRSVNRWSMSCDYDKKNGDAAAIVVSCG